jgi:hypothetical protein
MNKKNEQRRSRRVPAKRPVRVKKLNGIIQELEGQTRDVSLHGVFLYLSRKVTVGATLEVILPLPEGVGDAGDQWVRCRCRIVRVEPGPEEHQFGIAAMIEDWEPLAGSATAHA